MPYEPIYDDDEYSNRTYRNYRYQGSLRPEDFVAEPRCRHGHIQANGGCSADCRDWQVRMIKLGYGAQIDARASQ